MKIAYILYHDICSDSGVTKKIKDQVSTWQKNGHTVKIFSFVPRTGESILNANQYLIHSPWTSKIFVNRRMLNDLEIFNPDIIYYRYDIWNSTLAKILKKYKVVVELNTLDIHEFKLIFKKRKTLRSFLIYVAYRMLRGCILSNVSGIVAVTNEIAEDISVKKYNIKTICVPNGINLNEYRTIKEVNKTIYRPGFFFMGSPNQPWHGVDIIEKLAKQLQQYDFHIVGMDGDTSLDNLYWHGYLNKDSYIKILKQCQFCIGSLALYRNKMNEGSPIKVREYLAYGYPTIIGYKDTAFYEQNPDFLFYLDPSLSNIDELVLFIKKNVKRIVHSNEIKSISIESTEKKRLAFFESILSNL